MATPKLDPIPGLDVGALVQTREDSKRTSLRALRRIRDVIKSTPQYLQPRLLANVFSSPTCVHRVCELPQSHPIHIAGTRQQILKTRSIQQRYKKVQTMSFRVHYTYERHSRLKEDSASQGITLVGSIQGEREPQLRHKPNLPNSVLGHFSPNLHIEKAIGLISFCLTSSTFKDASFSM